MDTERRNSDAGWWNFTIQKDIDSPSHETLSGLVAAAPTKTVEKRADSCGQYASVATGAYTIYNDLWGESGATSGSGCIGVNSLSGSTVKWHSTWSWTGGSGVKSYPNAVVSLKPTQLKDITSMKSSFDWSYTGTSLVADVAYDMFTAASASGSSEYEIMVWLAAIGGAGPISSSYGSNGKPTAVGSTTIGGHTFNLYKGPNGATTVYSFVPTAEITSFSGDIKAFFTYLVKAGDISNTQYLTSVGAGTEPTSGKNAKFTVSAYSMKIAT
ncbi:hypothetical protein B0A55_08204 [Friedmanniomyces simplex]|uniref:Xyloglucan-specific endo-beta-1,4-glucanase A n=1 Tax=Friedmanniomyces simplex TaxID=329884 RepID=A0A4U0X545_9PEZI|nr:hypothetical protein B0A55_08204 [Friedmanniomyces simplex]